MEIFQYSSDILLFQFGFFFIEWIVLFHQHKLELIWGINLVLLNSFTLLQFPFFSFCLFLQILWLCLIKRLRGVPLRTISSKHGILLVANFMTFFQSVTCFVEQIHGVLNAVSWGIMLPIGMMIARYLRTFRLFHPAWFYLHVSCQVSAYAIGVAGWATGLKLGGQSKGVQYTTHRYIGITLFSLATLQV